MIMGQHLLIECRGQHAMLGSDDLKALMTDAAEAASATILYEHFHEFGGHGGITGVLILAESHITVHTWPEYQYAAFDIFMCGDAEPMKAAQVIADQFPDADVCIKAVARGFPRGEDGGFVVLVPDLVSAAVTPVRKRILSNV